MAIKELTLKEINESELRNLLRNEIPQIDRIENWVGILDLRLTGINTKIGDIFITYYEGIALQGYYPSVSTKLIGDGIVDRDNMLDMVRIESFGKNECEVVNLGFKGNSIQTFLRVYNPIYKRL